MPVLGAEIKELPLPESYSALPFEEIRLHHVPESSHQAVSYTHLTLPTIYSV